MRFSVDQLARPLLDADPDASPAVRVRAAGRLMTLLENEPQRLPELYRAASAAGASADRLQPGMLVGITGAPGSGKSTLTDAVVTAYRARFPERRIGVVAVDPSSPFTGGAVLGDRVRMMRHATDPNVFVRSLASRGRLGGLSLGVKGVIRAMALAGCDLVLLETVGVGQSEVEVVRVADITLVVMAPGQGDSVQMLKAGLMEAGDFFVINKADRDGAAALYAQLLASLQLGERPVLAARDPAKLKAGVALPIAGCHVDTATAVDDLAMQARPGIEVHLVSAQEGTGIEPLLDSLENQRVVKQSTWAERRDRALHEEVREAILEAGRGRLERTLGTNGGMEAVVSRLLSGAATIEQIADEVLRMTARDDSVQGPAFEGR